MNACKPKTKYLSTRVEQNMAAWESHGLIKLIMLCNGRTRNFIFEYYAKIYKYLLHFSDIL